MEGLIPHGKGDVQPASTRLPVGGSVNGPFEGSQIIGHLGLYIARSSNPLKAAHSGLLCARATTLLRLMRYFPCIAVTPLTPRTPAVTPQSLNTLTSLRRRSRHVVAQHVCTLPLNMNRDAATARSESNLDVGDHLCMLRAQGPSPWGSSGSEAGQQWNVSFA